jgi:hypothetical protein
MSGLPGPVPQAPWTLSVPSYIIPGTYLENVRFLESLTPVRAVELLFYYYDPGTRELLLRERDGLAARRGRFSFSVHLPDHLRPEHEELLELTLDLAGSYILHPPPSGERDFLRLVEGWRAKYGEIFLLENLIGRRFEELAGELPDLPLCLDTGHLLLGGSPMGGFLRRYGPRLREIHLHGVQHGADHRPFQAAEPWLGELGPFLRRFRGTVNLEVFCLAHLSECLAALRDSGLLPADLTGAEPTDPAAPAAPAAGSN